MTADLRVGDTVVFGGALTTGDESANVDVFLDGSRLTLAPNGSVTVDRYVSQGDTSTGEVAVSLVKGTLRFVSGRMHSESYSINTRFASLDVRGTRFVVVHDHSPGTTVIVEDGVVDFSNGRGQAVDVTAGKFSRIDRLGGTPSEPVGIGTGKAAAVANVKTSVAISTPPSVSMPATVSGVASSAAAASAAASSSAVA